MVCNTETTNWPTSSLSLSLSVSSYTQEDDDEQRHLNSPAAPTCFTIITIIILCLYSVSLYLISSLYIAHAHQLFSHANACISVHACLHLHACVFLLCHTHLRTLFPQSFITYTDVELLYFKIIMNACIKYT